MKGAEFANSSRPVSAQLFDETMIRGSLIPWAIANTGPQLILINSPAVRTETEVAFPLWEGLMTVMRTETKVGYAFNVAEAPSKPCLRYIAHHRIRLSQPHALKTTVCTSVPEGRNTWGLAWLLNHTALSSRGSSRKFILFTAGQFLPSYFPLSKTPENGGPIVNLIRICGPWDTRECCDFSPALIPISTEPRKATMRYKGTGGATRLSTSSDVLNHPVVEVRRIRQKKGWTKLRGCTHGPNGAST